MGWRKLNDVSRIEFIERGLKGHDIAFIDCALNFHDREEIAGYLGIRPKTVKTKFTRVYRILKLDGIEHFYMEMMPRTELLILQEQFGDIAGGLPSGAK